MGLPRIHMVGMHSALANLEYHIQVPVILVYRCAAESSDMRRMRPPVLYDTFDGMGSFGLISIRVREIV